MVTIVPKIVRHVLTRDIFVSAGLHFRHLWVLIDVAILMCRSASTWTVHILGTTVDL